MSLEMRKHILDKEKLARKYMPCVNNHIQKLTETYRELQFALTRVRGDVEAEFRDLQTTLHQKKEAILQKLDTSVSNQQETVRSYTQHAEKVTLDATKALDAAQSLAAEKNQKSFLARYSAVAQSLEQAVVDLLLLGEYVQHAEGINSGAKKLRSMELGVGVSIHCTAQLETIIDDIFSTCEEHDVNEEAIDNQETVSEQHVSELQIKPSCSALSGNQPPVVQYLELTEGSIMQVLITSVQSPSEFCAQPYSPLLIELKQHIWTFYSDLTAKRVKQFDVPPAVGDYCCARFSEDKCWYRAVITAAHCSSRPFQGKATRVSVLYIDYGNEERLPLSELRQLDPIFYSLPCQALYCTMPRIKPSQPLGLHPCDESTMKSQQVWPASVCRWFSNVVLGKTLHISVVSSGVNNSYGVDVHVPCDALYNPSNLKNLPRPPACIPYKGETPSLPVALSLTNFMVSVGLGVLCMSLVSSCGVQTESPRAETMQTFSDSCVQSRCHTQYHEDLSCRLEPFVSNENRQSEICIAQSEPNESFFWQDALGLASSSGNVEADCFTDTSTTVVTEAEAPTESRNVIESLESSISTNNLGQNSPVEHCITGVEVEVRHLEAEEASEDDTEQPLQHPDANSEGSCETLSSTSETVAADLLPIQTSCKVKSTAQMRIQEDVTEVSRSQLKLSESGAHYSDSVELNVRVTYPGRQYCSVTSPIERSYAYTTDGHSEPTLSEEPIPEMSPKSPDKFIGTRGMPTSMEEMGYKRSLIISALPKITHHNTGTDTKESVISKNKVETVAPHSDSQEGSITMELMKEQHQPSLVQLKPTQTLIMPDKDTSENSHVTLSDDEVVQQPSCLIMLDAEMESPKWPEDLELEAKYCNLSETKHAIMTTSQDVVEEPLVTLLDEKELHCEISQFVNEIKMQQDFVVNLDCRKELDSEIQSEDENKLSKNASQEEKEPKDLQLVMKSREEMELDINSESAISLEGEIQCEEETGLHLTTSEDEKECHSDNLTNLSDLNISTATSDDGKYPDDFVKAEPKEEIQKDSLTKSEGESELQTVLYQSPLIAGYEAVKALDLDCVSTSQIDLELVAGGSELDLQEGRKEKDLNSLLWKNDNELLSKAPICSDVHKGEIEGDKLGEIEGDKLGEIEGDKLGELEGDILGELEGEKLGELQGDKLGVESQLQFESSTSCNNGMELQLESTTNVGDRNLFHYELHQDDSVNKLNIESELKTENAADPENEKELLQLSSSNTVDTSKLVNEAVLNTKDGESTLPNVIHVDDATEEDPEGESAAVGLQGIAAPPPNVDLHITAVREGTSTTAHLLSGELKHGLITAGQDNCTPTTAMDLLTWESLSQPKSIILGHLNDFSVLVSHVNSPSQFYVHPVQPDTAYELDQLISSMSSHYSVETNLIPLSGQQYSTGAVCCIQSVDDGLWYRGIIMDQKTCASDKCSVLFVDYGDINLVDKNSVFVLNRVFLSTPVQSVCCSLCGVRPLNSGATYPSDTGGKECSNGGFLSVPSLEWSPEVSTDFESMVCGKQLVAFVAKNDNHSRIQYCMMQKMVVDVHLFDTSGISDIDIGTLLVMQGAAVWSEEAMIQENIKMQCWNPMELDFLNRRNNYRIDDEDAQLALQGYDSTSNRPCRFFNTTQGCRRGSNCPFLHLKEGQYDCQLEATFVRECGTVEMTMPSVGDWVAVLVTAVISATRFFVQLPLGNRNPFSSSQMSCKLPEESVWYETMELLTEEMSQHYNSKAFSDIEILEPHLGEIVAARYSVDEQWYRARVVDVSEKSVQVFFLDFGNVETVSTRDIRTIQKKFMHCPFQAIECCLSNVVCTSHTLKSSDAKQSFINLITDHLLIAEVIWRGYSNVLGLNLFYAKDADQVPELHLNKLLVERGFATWFEETATTSDDVKVFPG